MELSDEWETGETGRPLFVRQYNGYLAIYRPQIAHIVYGTRAEHGKIKTHGG